MFHNERLSVLLMIVAVSSTLITQQLGMRQVYASESSPYDSGYDHGCDDAGRSESDKYINQPEKGPSFHTQEFMNGYYAGLSSCGGGGGGGFSGPQRDESDEGFSEGSQDFGERYYEGWNWRQICSDVDAFLSESCNDLVTSDGNALTAEGKEALERIACGGQSLLGVLLTNDLLAALQGLRC